MQQVAEKKIKEIFKDFNINSYILNSKIQSINLYKKQNRLEIELEVDSKVKVKEISAFEKYLIKRFLLKDIIIKIKYHEAIENNYLEEWNDILDYLSYKHPLTKALLKNSSINLENNKLNINLPYTGSDILYAQKIDGIISNIIERFYSEKIKICFIDNNSEETMKNILESNKKMQEDLILEFKNKTDAENEASENNTKKHNENDIKGESNNQKENKTVVKEQMPEVENSSNKPEEVTPLILGRNQNIKDPLTKVIDISIDSGKICLDGEIINTDSRELKSGKFLFMFDLYDGTSTITCKAFIEKEKFKEVSGRIKDAKGVKIGGTAQFDPFAKELRSYCKYYC